MEKIVVANLKMNMTAIEVNNYLESLKDKINTKKVVICPPNIYIPYFLRKKYSVGTQDAFHINEGAYTGEVSAKQISSMGIKYTLLGHSERRQIFKETDIVVNKKVINALDNSLNVILCIGETKEERELFKTETILKRQLMNGLRNVSLDKANQIIVAYEPIWSIGTGIVPTNKDIATTTKYIKGMLKKMFGTDIRVLYGGSVNEKNIETINKVEDISGVLVGGASLDADKLNKIKEVVLN